jgi:hypothetical protein
MPGTCVFPFCSKCDTATENTIEAEMAAGNHLGKALRWLHLFMDNLGLAEDNAATCIITHTWKLTCNVSHIALKTISLQTLVQERIAMFRTIGSANNQADHFTKALPQHAHHDPCCNLMGLHFSLLIMLLLLFVLSTQHHDSIFHITILGSSIT